MHSIRKKNGWKHSQKEYGSDNTHKIDQRIKRKTDP